MFSPALLDIAFLTCFDQNKNDPICVMPPKVAKASKEGDIVMLYRYHFSLQTLPVYMKAHGKVCRLNGSDIMMQYHLSYLPCRSWVARHR
jgi:hypothetical protein